MSRVTIIDYGMGNLLSVARAFQYCGAAVDFAHGPADVDAAERLVLPGVGAFGDGMKELEQRGLSAAIRRAAERNRPLLGICLGMQMLFSSSEEFGHTTGLGLIAGRVERIPAESNGVARRIPHVGWARLAVGPSHGDWRESVLDGLSPGAVSAYFVHSYAAAADPAAVLAVADYRGYPVTAVVSAGSVSGCQFHPEKSGPAGLHVLGNFIKQ